MAILILVRHGHAVSSEKNIYSSDLRVPHPLTERGTAQAERTGAELARLKRMDGLYSSTTLRAKQTAEIIAKAIGGVEVKVDPRLRERNYGDLEDQQVPEDKSWHRQALSHGAESFTTVMGRTMEFTHELPDKDGVYIAVTHITSIRAQLAISLQIGEDGLDGFDPHNCSLVTVDLTKGSVLSLGSFSVPAFLAKQAA